MAIFQRYRPGGALPLKDSPDSEDDFDPTAAQPGDFGPTAMDDGSQFAPAPANGPNAALQQIPTAPEPSARMDSMDQGAGKAPPPLAGAPVAPPDDHAAPTNVPPEMRQQSPLAPPPMAGAPKSKQDLALEQYAALQPPTAPHQNIIQKIAQGVLSATRLGPEGAAQIMHPNYTQQMAQYGAKKADLAKQIDLADKAEDITSKSDSRLGNEDARIQNAQNTLQQHGGVLLPAGQKAPDGYIQIASPLANTPKYQGATAWIDPHFGKFQVTPEQAKLSNGAASANQWLPLSAMSTFIKGGIDQNKPDAADKGQMSLVSASTAKSLGISSPPDQNGNVSVPTTLLAKTLETKAPKEVPTATQIGLKRMGLPANTDINTLSSAQATKLAQFSKADAQEFHVTTGNEGTWSIQEDADGKPIEYNSKTGEVRPVAAGGIQKSGTKAKQEAAIEKEVGPARDALQYANDYLGQNHPTGPKDEALMEKFFELAKPSTGFRMSQPQIDMLKHAQSWMNGFKASAYHAATGTWFSGEQRKEIVDAMNTIANAKLKNKSTPAAATPGTSSPASPAAGTAKPKTAADYLKSIGH